MPQGVHQSLLCNLDTAADVLECEWTHNIVPVFCLYFTICLNQNRSRNQLCVDAFLLKSMRLFENRIAETVTVVMQFLEGLSNMALWVGVPLQSSASKASAQQQPLVSALQGLRPMDSSPSANGARPQGHSAMGNGSSAASPDGDANASQAASAGSGKALPDESCGGSSEWSRLWHQLHALTGFNPRLGVLLMVLPLANPHCFCQASDSSSRALILSSRYFVTHKTTCATLAKLSILFKCQLVLDVRKQSVATSFITA